MEIDPTVGSDSQIDDHPIISDSERSTKPRSGISLMKFLFFFPLLMMQTGK
jgi:hypothetical protein